jgi:hypothetical protein
MRVVDDNLTNIGNDWGQWPAWSHRCLVRKARDRWVCLTPLLKRWAIVSGPLATPGAATDIWLYTDPRHAIVAASEWTGIGEPQGWAWHPRSGRHRFRPRS